MCMFCDVFEKWSNHTNIYALYHGSIFHILRFFLKKITHHVLLCFSFTCDKRLLKFKYIEKLKHSV